MSALPNTVVSSQAEKEKLLALRRESRQRVLASFAGVTEDESRRRPAEESWSVLETVEHLTAAETVMLRLLKSPRSLRPADAPNREAAFLERMGTRIRKVETPESGRPTGRFASLAEARARFETTRAGTIGFVEQNEEDLRATEVAHPHPLVGKVSTYEMVIIIAKHAERHALQIEEIRNSPGFRGDVAAESRG